MRLQTILYDAGSAARVIAKIENREGIEHLPEIMECAWGILIARGDLGIEIPAAQVPLIQKAIIRQCRQAGKPVILATHILGSMTGNIRPTQAEVNDVANAVLDGVDALTLTGETAEGIYPVKVTKTLSELCRYTEAWQDEAIANKEQYPEGDHQLMQVIHKVLDAAGKKSICAVIDETASDMVVNMLAAARCGVPVLQRCVSPVQKRQCVLHYGVFPLSDSLTKHSPGSFVFDENARVAVLKSVPAGAKGKIDIEYTTAKGIDIITII